ncbi:hypothetical protein PV10_01182 [Exophiala mesophila]|uniref:Uncharacterized protein n=1 Tax=Exophiala mesophila TaxID=212818 RepID=A0A0D2AEU2_EXOME|nr:uncharacterized protein PV10_01182 [Exophiala mesophila]KIV97428.1 hypothetical protein PV10_01182 [Exophiala mesophila]
MSVQYTVTERRKRTTNSGGFGHSGNRSTFGYWVPLTLTVTAAVIGIAAWIWSERHDDEEDYPSEDEHYPGAPGGVPPPGYANMSGGLPVQSQQSTGIQGPPPGVQGYQGPPGPGPTQPGGFGGPQVPQGFQPPPGTGAPDAGPEYRSSRSAPNDWASKTFAAGAAGVAAAGAMVGGAINSFTGGGTYEDHERWSEEASQRQNNEEIKQGIRRRGTADEFFSGSVGLPKLASTMNSKRKTVVVVVSALEKDTPDSSEFGNHASILAHLPEYIDPDKARIFVLIYAPDLKIHPSSAVAGRRPSQSMASSFSNISHKDVQTPGQTPGEFPSDGILTQVEPNPIDEASPLYKDLHNQAMSLVDKDSMIIPFASQNGHKHVLRSLAPEIVYIQESLCGSEGEIVSDLSGWVRQTVVVIGDEGGQGGLIDTDDESTVTVQKETWWQKEERTGLGKRVAVVESLKIGDDWQRRVNERD